MDGKNGYNKREGIPKEASTIRTNFHSHTTRCQHATGRDEQYVTAAIAAGYAQLGMSDHGPWPYGDGYVSGIRMRLDEFPGYLASARALKEKYREQIAIYVGLESEYYPAYSGWLAEQAEAERLGFLILGSHFDRPDEDIYFGGITQPHQLYRYARHTILGLRSGLYCCLAHPDLFMLNYPAFDEDCAVISRDIAQAARDLGIPLEYNLSGLYPQSWRRGPGYPAAGFWQIAAQEGASAIIGLDAHDPGRYADTHLYDQAVRDLAQLGINRVDSLVPCRMGKRLAV